MQGKEPASTSSDAVTLQKYLGILKRVQDITHRAFKEAQRLNDNIADIGKLVEEQAKLAKKFSESGDKEQALNCAQTAYELSEKAKPFIADIEKMQRAQVLALEHLERHEKTLTARQKVSGGDFLKEVEKALKQTRAVRELLMKARAEFAGYLGRASFPLQMAGAAQHYARQLLSELSPASSSATSLQGKRSDAAKLAGRRSHDRLPHSPSHRNTALQSISKETNMTQNDIARVCHEVNRA